MILEKDNDTGYWIRLKGHPNLVLNTHDSTQCAGRPCAIHDRPSNHPLKSAPLNWRVDRGILERICEHGTGHPDYDSAQYLKSIGLEAENIHGCCGCCTTFSD